MESSEAQKIAVDHLRFVDAAVRHAVHEPRVPLWPGVYRETSPGRWEPINLEDWRSLAPVERVDLVVSQMRQIAQAIDTAGFVFRLEGGDLQGAAFSADDMRRGVHLAMCRVYQELKAAGSIVTVGTLATAMLLRLFFGELPLAGEGTAGAVALIQLYGERFCGSGGGISTR